MWRLCLQNGQTEWSEIKGCCSIKNFGKKAFFDINSPLTPVIGDKKHWLLFIEDSSNYSWSFLLEENSDLAGVMLGLIENLKNKYYMHIQYLCCDNAGENVIFEKACKQEGLTWDFENYCPRYATTELQCQEKFTTLFNQVCVILNSGKFNAFLHKGLWAKLWTSPCFSKIFINTE